MSALPSPSYNDPLPSPRQSISNPYSTPITARAEAYMEHLFGTADLESFLKSLETYMPDLRTLIVNQVYGVCQTEMSVLGPIETSVVNVASLVGMDCSEEVG